MDYSNIPETIEARWHYLLCMEFKIDSGPRFLTTVNTQDVWTHHMKTAIVPLKSCFPSVRNGKGGAAVYGTGCCETK